MVSRKGQWGKPVRKNVVTKLKFVIFSILNQTPCRDIRSNQSLACYWELRILYVATAASMIDNSRALLDFACYKLLW
jgi:hypothetical protein